jgi:hypothetical protein
VIRNTAPELPREARQTSEPRRKVGFLFIESMVLSGRLSHSLFFEEKLLWDARTQGNRSHY